MLSRTDALITSGISLSYFVSTSRYGYMACVFFLPLLVQDVLDLVDQSWLSIIGTSVAVVARDTLLPRLVLGDGVVFGCAFPAGKCGVTTGTVGIGLE